MHGKDERGLWFCRAAMLCRNALTLLCTSSSSAICVAPLSTTAARMRRHGRLHGKQKFGMQEGNIDVHGPANPVPVPPPPPPRHPDVPFRRANIATDTPYARRMAFLSRRIHSELQSVLLAVGLSAFLFRRTATARRWLKENYRTVVREAC